MKPTENLEKLQKVLLFNLKEERKKNIKLGLKNTKKKELKILKEFNIEKNIIKNLK